MKKIFFMLLAAISLTACDTGDDNSTITGYNRTELNQTLHADQTEGDFTFTASQSWTTQITDATPARSAAEGDTWITLDPSHGDAGTVQMKITLTPNLTGADRKATIKILCGDTIITLTVEQRATVGDDPEPEIPGEAKVISRINTFWDGAPDGHVTFEYDAEGRTTQFCTYDNAGVWMSKQTMTYTQGKIRVESRESDYPDLDIKVFTLDANGRIVSYEETIDGKEFTCDYSYDANGYLTDYCAGLDYGIEVAPIMNHAVWENGNMKTHYDAFGGNYESKTEFEYTNHKSGFATIDLMTASWPIVLRLLKTGTFGKISKNLIAKETVTGDRYEAGVYRSSYKFDDTGFYVTEFTRAFTPAADNPIESYTETMEIIYR